MPLKHNAETAYIVILAAVIAVTGILLAWLPASPKAIVAWSILLLITAVYPLVLAPTLKDNRADYEFRWLHVFPLMMVLLWGLAALGVTYFHWSIVLLPFTFIWSLPFVAIGFIALSIFCVAVVRRSPVRLRYLSALFSTYLLVGGFAYLMDWNSTVTAVLFDDTILGENVVTSYFAPADAEDSTDAEAGTGTGIDIVSRVEERRRQREEQNRSRYALSSSSSSSSRRVSVRSSSSRVARSSSSAPAVSSSSSSSSRRVIVRASSSSSSSRVARPPSSSSIARSSSLRSSSSSSRSAIASGSSSSSSSKPPKLPKSGGEVAFAGIAFLAGYCGLLHRRTQRAGGS